MGNLLFLVRLFLGEAHREVDRMAGSGLEPTAEAGLPWWRAWPGILLPLGLLLLLVGGIALYLRRILS